jgi:hypothetical protein
MHVGGYPIQYGRFDALTVVEVSNEHVSFIPYVVYDEIL